MIEVLTALLDRSVARIAELTADARHFDRLEVVRIADVWDNNSGPLFGVLSAPRRQRAAHGRLALEWMAGFGAKRQQWMAEQVALAGYALEALPVADEGPYRDYRGMVRHSMQPLDASLGEDYDLERARISSVRVEQAGHALNGFIGLEVPRRYGVAGNADVQVYLTGLDDCRFDNDDRRGVAVADGEVKLGEHGFVRAAGAEYWLDDDSWHLSQAGRRADAVTPPRPPRNEVKLRQPDGWAYAAAAALHEAMIRIRSVRYARLVGKVPVDELAGLLANAGSDARRAARWPWGYQRLAERWSREIEKPARPPAALGDHLTLAAIGTGVVLNSAVRNEKGTWELRSAELPPPNSFRLTAQNQRIIVDGEWSNETGQQK
ncbi:hypothetical protein OWR29_17170 [Actinoplanes sp. Pm04-4]|uniref:Uncharacterized protein n=1 Tax=Paractinoplanes pyxinae TaxID=2997416 RepID=A0ABT4AZR8_9ACTN|nr:hypothetical protein [Actinoplanes pyxinae]MCY1139734.1 hypothetical protein [Actinoplanes pyxinae]